MDAIETKALVAKLRDRGGTFYSSDAEMMRQAEATQCGVYPK